MSVLYGHKIKRLNYKKNLTKLLFGIRFFNILSYLEFRLDIIVLRAGLAIKLCQAKVGINRGFITVNAFRKKSYYLVRVGDIIREIKHQKKNYSTKRCIRKQWRHYKWRKWRKCNRYALRAISNRFGLAKKGLTINFLEINYRVVSCIPIRKLFLGEIIIENRRRMLSKRVLKKLYYLY
jgi:hypothetical protein